MAKRKRKAKKLTDAQLLRAYERLLGEEFENLDEARAAFADEIEEQKIVPIGSDFDRLNEMIEALDNPNMQTLFDRHYGEDGYNFDIEDEILKISISTTKTRKKFSVRS